MIIELAGPPGSGKSTVANALVRRIPDARLVTYPYFRRIRDVPFFIRHYIRLIPVLFRLRRDSRGARLTRRDLAVMTILMGWDRSLAKKRRGGSRVIVLEEGGICLMARLRSFGSELLRGPKAAPWWDRTLASWARTLDLVVRLETPGSILEDRVRSRGIPHEISHLSGERAVAWLENLRLAINDVIHELRARDASLAVVDTDSSGQSLEHLLAMLTAFIDKPVDDPRRAAALPL